MSAKHAEVRVGQFAFTSDNRIVGPEAYMCARGYKLWEHIKAGCDELTVAFEKMGDIRVAILIVLDEDFGLWIGRDKP